MNNRPIASQQSQPSQTKPTRYNKIVSAQILNTEDFKATETKLKANAKNFDSEGNHLAPNGQKSNLTYNQWVQVRTESFKKWFGDWEKSFRIKKLYQSEPLVFNWSTDSPAYNLNPNSAKVFLQNNYQRETFENDDTGEKYVLGKRGRQKLLSHSRNDTAYLKSLYFLPEIIKNSIFITETDSYKENGKYDHYRYLVCGINLDGVDYTVKSVFGLDSNGKWVYDQGLSEIEKGTLIGMLNKHVTQDSLQLKDSTLFSILQDDSSTVVDENGEPKPLFHNTNAEFNKFESNKIGSNTGNYGAFGYGFYLAYDSKYASGFGENQLQLFVNAKNVANINPYSSDYVGDEIIKEALGNKAPDSINSTSIAYALLRDGDKRTPEAFSNFFKERGYDAITNSGEFVVFYPNQIKSASNNNGIFDSNDPVIYRKNVDTAYTYSQGIKLTKPTNLIKPTMPTKPTNLTKPTKPTMPTNLTKATNPTKRLLMGY